MWHTMQKSTDSEREGNQAHALEKVCGLLGGIFRSCLGLGSADVRQRMPVPAVEQQADETDRLHMQNMRESIYKDPKFDFGDWRRLLLEGVLVCAQSYSGYEKL